MCLSKASAVGRKGRKLSDLRRVSSKGFWKIVEREPEITTGFKAPASKNPFFQTKIGKLLVAIRVFKAIYDYRVRYEYPDKTGNPVKRTFNLIKEPHGGKETDQPLIAAFNRIIEGTGDPAAFERAMAERVKKQMEKEKTKK